MATKSIFTLTKKDLLRLVDHLNDDDKVYIHTKTADAQAAIAATSNSDELFFGLTRDTVNEADGMSLVAYFPK